VSRKALGKGLEALIPDHRGDAGEGDGKVVEIIIDEIAASPYQPRSKMDELSLGDLSESIGEKGVLQPVIVRRKSGGFELVAGERRLRAAKMAKLKSIPALIKMVSDSEALEIALVENLQREDLNPIDEARGYRELINRFNLTQEDLARKLGRDRSTIANVLRLLALPDQVKRGVEEGKITMGHARALLSLEDSRQIETLYRSVVHRGLSVRQVEGLVRRRLKARGRKSRGVARINPEIGRMEDDLQRRFGTRVRIISHGGHGKIEIEFYSNDDLTRIIEALG
jgi:ParB family chromosome partitioning protein